ncbi:nuclear transport factor 2 family protein [Sphingopyxis sp. YF1]|uniref:nuclear transport factor 2 family protein n=1 Tax=Sphingopyxis sp. YF1 TaxID=2482763 RepID=UPI001F60A34A|nr:nuclear transport factor 2 family protein [Sphingopyxis sp. YF1]UNU42472.1 nuclear transport factor 2 family protein [Sphingopyxis sp. YF1]
MAEQDDIRAMAQRFFDAIEAGDIETIKDSFTPDAEIWHNTDELVVTRDQTAQVLTAMVARIGDREYADRQLTVFPGGFVQQHVLKGKRVHDGGAVRLPCAIICKVVDGRITRLDEYFDSAHVAEFRKFANA